MNTLRAMTVLQISDMKRSAEFYNALGFGVLGAWGDPSGVAIMQRGDVTLMLQVAETVNNAGGRWSVYIYVDDIDALHDDLTAAGVAVTGPPEDKDYGCRDFGVYDPDSHCLAFGHDTNSAPYANGLGPERGRG